MTKKEAKSFKNFGYREKSVYGTYIFENYEQIAYQFVKWLDNLVTFAKQEYGKKARFIIYDFNLLKHASHSFHYAIDNHLCLAVDGYFTGLTPYEGYMIISKFRATGIGWYPDWKPHPGWHIDKRPELIAREWLGKASNMGQVYDYNFKHFIEAIRGATYGI